MCSLIEGFPQISDYKINRTNKSEVMPLSTNSYEIRERWPFKWVLSGMVYLGIKPVPGLEKIIMIIFNHLFREIQNFTLC